MLARAGVAASRLRGAPACRRAAAVAPSRALASSASPYGQEAEGPEQEQLRFATALKALCGAWLTYKLVETVMGSDTQFIAPNLVLLRSQDEGNRAAGISRILRWHSREHALREVVAQGGAESLLAALPVTREAASRLEALELLVLMAPLDDGGRRLRKAGAAEVAAASCAGLGEGGDAAARCAELAGSLAAALEAAGGEGARGAATT